MSLIRVIYNRFIKKNIDSFTFDFNIENVVAYIFSHPRELKEVLKFIKEVKSGKLIDSYEMKELLDSQELAVHITNRKRLLPLIIALIDDKEKGMDTRQTLWEHRFLIHALYFNKEDILIQLNDIIYELELRVRNEEQLRGSMKVVSPSREMLGRGR